jgi:hypothetical protein
LEAGAWAPYTVTASFQSPSAAGTDDDCEPDARSVRILAIPLGVKKDSAGIKNEEKADMRKLLASGHAPDNRSQFLSLSALIFKPNLISLVMEDTSKSTQGPNEHCARLRHSFHLETWSFRFIGSQDFVRRQACNIQTRLNVVHELDANTWSTSSATPVPDTGQSSMSQQDPKHDADAVGRANV